VMLGLKRGRSERLGSRVAPHTCKHIIAAALLT
jgi:hypothetical protein